MHARYAAEEKPKTRKEKRSEWDLLNDSKAIWLRKPKVRFGPVESELELLHIMYMHR